MNGNARAILWAAALCSGGCAHKVVMTPQGGIIHEGGYRSCLERADGGRERLSLNLYRDGRFTYERREGGCIIGQESGTWEASPEMLVLRRTSALATGSCGGYESPAKELVRENPIRALSTMSFQMLLEGDGGQQWMEWSQRPTALACESNPLPGPPSGSSMTVLDGNTR